MAAADGDIVCSPRMRGVATGTKGRALNADRIMMEERMVLGLCWLIDWRIERNREIKEHGMLQVNNMPKTGQKQSTCNLFIPICVKDY